MFRSHSPFEALLAASGTFEAAESSRSCEKPQAGKAFQKPEFSSAEQSELDSADNTALGGAYAEGVGTSGGGESGDTGYLSDDSRDMQVCSARHEPSNFVSCALLSRCV